MRVIALVNRKAGSGKTTSAISLAAALHKLGNRTLLIDVDDQASLSTILNLTGKGLRHNILHVLLQQVTMNQAIIMRDGMGILPSSPELYGIEMQLAELPGCKKLLSNTLEKLSDWDYVVIDSPANLGLLTINAFNAATDIIIPFQTQFLALTGIRQLYDFFDRAKTENPKLHMLGVLATRYDEKNGKSKEVLETIQRYFGGQIFRTVISDAPVFSEAAAEAKTIFEYDEESAAAREYIALAKEITERRHK